jgi:hypothetical protein
MITEICDSGILAVTTNEGLSAYTLSMENDLLTWSQKWNIPSVVHPDANQRFDMLSQHWPHFDGTPLSLINAYCHRLNCKLSLLEKVLIH